MKTPLYVCIALALAACSKQEAPDDAIAPAITPSEQTAAAPLPNAPVELPAGAYTLDPIHSSLLFRVNHLGMSKYTGRFETFSAQLQVDPQNLATASVNVTVDAKSLDVANPPAGFIAELIGANWLDTEQFPSITYRSASVAATGSNAAKITGDLTLHGITRPIVLNATLNGGYAGHPMDPRARIGFSAHGTFKRSDFGIANGIPAPGTTIGVGDEVEVIIETELSGPKWTPAASETTSAVQ